MATKIRIEFVSEGFMGVLSDPGTVSLLNSLGAKRRAEFEAAEGIPYEVRQSAAWDGRPRVIVSAVRPLPKAEFERTPDLTHERWVNDIWPKVGGPKYRRSR